MLYLLLRLGDSAVVADTPIGRRRKSKRYNRYWNLEKPPQTAEEMIEAWKPIIESAPTERERQFDIIEAKKDAAELNVLSERTKYLEMLAALIELEEEEDDYLLLH